MLNWFTQRKWTDLTCCNQKQGCDICKKKKKHVTLSWWSINVKGTRLQNSATIDRRHVEEEEEGSCFRLIYLCSHCNLPLSPRHLSSPPPSFCCLNSVVATLIHSSPAKESNRRRAPLNPPYIYKKREKYIPTSIHSILSCVIQSYKRGVKGRHIDSVHTLKKNNSS